MEMSEKSFESAVHVLEGEFINTQSERKKYSQLDILTEEKDQFISRTFLYYVRIRGSEFIRQMKDIVELGIRRYSEVYQKEMDDLGLSLYQKYSSKDICRLLNWEKDAKKRILQRVQRKISSHYEFSTSNESSGERRYLSVFCE